MATKPQFPSPLLRCIDCYHYKGARHPEYNQPCIKLDQRPGTPAPKCFTPNIPAIANITGMEKLLDVASRLDEEQRRILAGIFWNASTLERTPFTFLQKVYFFVGDKSNLADWCYGWLLAKDGTQAQLISDPKARKPRYCTLPMSLLKTKEEFDELKEKLLYSSRLTATPLKARRMAQEDWEPPNGVHLVAEPKKKSRPPKVGFNIDQEEDEADE